VGRTTDRLGQGDVLTILAATGADLDVGDVLLRCGGGGGGLEGGRTFEQVKKLDPLTACL